jgi:hypothetical protein
MTFGDEALAWVNNTVAKQSHDLADADYRARTQAFHLDGRADVLGRSQAEAADLESIAKELQSLDAFQGDEMQTAVRREEVAQLILAALYRARSNIAESRRRLDVLDAQPSRVGFVRDGLGAVGRETLLLSLAEIGKTSEASLGGRYTIYVSVTLNEDGSYQSSDMTVAGTAGTVGGALINIGAESDNPYLIAAGAVLEFGALTYEGIKYAGCQEKLENQRAEVRQATTLLPGKLITADAQWALYQQHYADQLTIFHPSSAPMRSYLDELDERWKVLFAANGVRLALAQQDLTDVKIKEIQSSFQNGDPTGIFKNIALTQVASDVQHINTFIAGVDRNPLLSCATSEGFSARDDATDGLDFVRTQMTEIRKGGDFAPLYDLLDNSVARVDRARHGIPPAPKTAPKRCKLAAPFNATAYTLHEGALPLITVGSRADVVDLGRSSVARQITPAIAPRLTLVAFDPGTPAGSICAVFSNGSVYSCSSSGAGRPYDGEFNHGSGNPQSDVLWGASDGGYAADAHRVSQKISDASRNIDRRITSLTNHTSAVGKAVPDWISKNGAALGQLVQQVEGSTKGDQQNETKFENETANLEADAKHRIDDFLKSPGDLQTSQDLIASFKGVDFSLPSLPATAVVPDVPVITGVTAAKAAFGDRKSVMSQRIERERLKEASELTGLNASLGAQLVDMADRFEARGAHDLANDMLLDAASIRFAKRGALKTAQITVVQPDGSLASVPWKPSEGFPANALVQRSRAFSAVDGAYVAESSALRQVLSGGGPNATERGAVLDTADTAEQLASQSFYSGNILTGERLQRFAMGMADIASRFIPGVNWGRDVYEAVSGEDMFTGKHLDDVSRTIAILGAVSAGVLDDAVGAAHAVEELEALEKLGQLGLPAERCKEILDAAKNVRMDGLRIDPHALEAMAAEPLGEITREEVKDAVNRGSKWFNTEEQTIVAIERDVAPGEVRVGVGIDMDSKVIPTAYRELKSDAELETAIFGKNGRYIPLIK